MAEGKLYRLITVGLWAGICCWPLLLVLLISDGAKAYEVLDFIQDAVVLEKVWLANLMVWLYPIMLVVQYVVEGSFKWFPWDR